MCVFINIGIYTCTHTHKKHIIYIIQTHINIYNMMKGQWLFNKPSWNHIWCENSRDVKWDAKILADTGHNGNETTWTRPNHRTSTVLQQKVMKSYEIPSIHCIRHPLSKRFSAFPLPCLCDRCGHHIGGHRPLDHLSLVSLGCLSIEHVGSGRQLLDGFLKHMSSVTAGRGSIFRSQFALVLGLPEMNFRRTVGGCINSNYIYAL